MKFVIVTNTPIPGTVFEVYHARSGNLVDTIRTDKNGVAVSKPLPLGRYKIVESQAADFYALDKTPIEVEIEHEGQIVRAAMTNKSLYTNVSIKKTGYVEVMPGQQIRYDLSGIANNSTTSLTSFYWRDTLPTQAVRLDKLCICGEDVTEYTERQMQALRGSKISMIFQDALTALNPVMTIGKQMDEIYRCHEKISKKQARLRSIEALEAVGIPDAKLRYHAFPHELSGGMRQRVLIAMAFACEPDPRMGVKRRE